jgi:AcrR family transcriptional regulator
VTPGTQPAGPGRPRDAATHRAVLAATRRLLLDGGYHALTFEAVAQAAGTTRTTLYRWWPTRGALVLEAAADHLHIGTVPDTGDSHHDLRAAVSQLVSTFSDPLARIVILAAISNLDGDGTMAATFRDTWVYPWRRTATDALQRAIHRGDLPTDADSQFLLNVIVGTVFQSTITVATPTTDNLADQLTHLLLGPGPR